MDWWQCHTMGLFIKKKIKKKNWWQQFKNCTVKSIWRIESVTSPQTPLRAVFFPLVGNSISLEMIIWGVHQKWLTEHPAGCSSTFVAFGRGVWHWMPEELLPIFFCTEVNMCMCIQCIFQFVSTSPSMASAGLECYVLCVTKCFCLRLLLRNIRQVCRKCITLHLLGNTEKYKEEMKKTQKTEGKVSF